MKALICIFAIILAIVPFTVNQTHLFRRVKSSNEQYAVTIDSEPFVDASIESSNGYCSDDNCYSSSYYQSQSSNIYRAALLLPELLVGSYLLLSAFFCALFNTCSSYPTVTFTTSVTVTDTVTTTTTTPTTTTTRTSTTTPTTRTTVRRTRSTTILPTTFTSISTTRIRTTTTEFPTTTTTTTSTTPTTTTTTPTSTFITTSVTITTSTRDQSNNGNGSGRHIAVNEDFWKVILLPDDLEVFEDLEIIPSEILGTVDVTQSLNEVSSAALVHGDTWTSEIIGSITKSTANLAATIALSTSDITNRLKGNMDIWKDIMSRLYAVDDST